ncbi:MAG: hypothetical protein FIB08_03280 [Candidatus Methanoperedens sp.]|nr:hypothetical protein [Candidatus Methanoperedens sp.]
MFILDKSKFCEFNLNNVKEFIKFWKQFYPGDNVKIFDSDNKISYINELNLKNDLTEDNVKRLLRWKDPLRLTEKIGNTRRENEKVLRVLEKMGDINNFRKRKISESDFFKKTRDIFPTGFVWQVFLFHIARPVEYPIADRYVYRAFTVLNEKNKVLEGWNGYTKYKEFFFDIVKSAEINPENKNDTSDIVSRLKEIDNALFAFGQFLDKYHPQSEDM